MAQCNVMLVQNGGFLYSINPIQSSSQHEPALMQKDRFVLNQGQEPQNQNFLRKSSISSINHEFE